MLRELRAVAFVKRLVEEGKFSPDEYKEVHLHRFDGSGALDDYEASSKRNADGISSCRCATPGGGPLNLGSRRIAKRSGCAARSICAARCREGQSRKRQTVDG